MAGLLEKMDPARRERWFCNQRWGASGHRGPTKII